VPLEYQELIDSLTLEEKASLLSGANFWNTKRIERLGIPSIMLTDGPHGLRKQAGKEDHLGINESVPATCFPTAAALANSWDEALVEQVGRAIGAEAVANKVGAVLGPGLNIVRDPLAGRAFEYFSEDPYVAGKLAAGLVRGIQSNGIAATPKHFAVNSQEHLRMSIDEIVDERTMHEIYLEGFRRAVEEGKPKLLMTAYNKINGTYANEHEQLLGDILHGEWRYDGALVTDWGGNHDPVAGVRIGGALEMPSSNGLSDAKLVEAVKAGALEEATLDMRVNTIVKLVTEANAALKNASEADYDEHHQLAVEAAGRSMVLLKNEAHLLPLTKGTRVALIGDFAKTPRYQGAGSSLVNPTRLVSALDAFSHNEAVRVVGFEPGFKRTGGKSAARVRGAVKLAKNADVAVVFLGLDEAKEAEGIDRATMALPSNQLELIHAIAAVHNKVVVVLSAGGPVELPFADDVAAIIHGSLTGQATGAALADIMTGRRTPSGKLAVSYPLQYSDAPTVNYFPGKERTAEHREGLYVGYRYYETADVAVRYPFGFGLSYTSFEYSDISADASSASFSITNTGAVVGEEIAQVYVRPSASGVFRPTRELKGFVKVLLQPGETKRVTVQFDVHTFAHYDTAAHAWVVAGGEYGVEVGASVRDIRLETSVTLPVSELHTTYDKDRFAAYYSGKVRDISNEDFEAVLGRPLPLATWNRKARLGYDDTIAQLRYGHIRGRLFYGFLRLVQRLLFALKKPNQANNVTFVINLPFSKLPGFTGGKLSEKAVRKLFGLKG